jgi:hypothetical protein
MFKVSRAFDYRPDDFEIRRIKTQRQMHQGALGFDIG